MAENIYLIFEILAVLFCLYGLFGVKMKWGTGILLFSGAELAVCQAAAACGHFWYYKLFMLLLLLVHAKLQFRRSLKITMINYVLCLVVSTTLQLICSFPLMIWYYELLGCAGYLINGALLLLMVILYKSGLLYKAALYMQEKGRMPAVFLTAAAFFCAYAFYILQTSRQLSPLEYFLTVASITLLFFFLLKLQIEKLRGRQFREKINSGRLYGEALAARIDHIRRTQHGYKNQLAAIQGMIYTAGSLEDLRQEHQKYCDNLISSDKYINFLDKKGNDFITGFLVYKISEIEKRGITAECSLEIGDMGESLLQYDAAEILGSLIDNAAEEVERGRYPRKAIEVRVCREKKLSLEVGNICRYIHNEEAAGFFQKGFSSKGKDRGIGLYHVEEMVKEWRGKIRVENREKEGENWFYITIEMGLRKRL